MSQPLGDNDSAVSALAVQDGIACYGTSGNGKKYPKCAFRAEHLRKKDATRLRLPSMCCSERHMGYNHCLMILLVMILILHLFRSDLHEIIMIS